MLDTGRAPRAEVLTQKQQLLSHFLPLEPALGIPEGGEAESPPRFGEQGCDPPASAVKRKKGRIGSGREGGGWVGRPGNRFVAAGGGQGSFFFSRRARGGSDWSKT